MNFLRQIHRSIFDPSLYAEVLRLSPRQPLLFVLNLLLLAALISGTARTLYLLDNKRGIAAPLAAAFEGMEIRDGLLRPNRPLPYEVTPDLAATIFSRIFAIPAGFGNSAVPSMVVDTSPGRPSGTAPPAFVMKLQGVLICIGADVFIPVPWREVLFGAADLRFSRSEIDLFLKRKSPFILVYSCAVEGVRCAAVVLFCICIFVLAAYIFRIERERRAADFLKMASFAISPIPVGVILIAISDVQIPGAWNILVIASVAVMFRALQAVLKKAKDAEARGG